MGCNSVKDQLDKLFVLCCLWDSRAYIRLFLGVDSGSVFNINYEPKDCLEAIEELLDLGLLEITWENGSSVDNWRELAEKSHARDAENKLIVGLTKDGGRIWEEFFGVDWSSYVSELNSERCGEWSIKIFDLNVAERIMRWAVENDLVKYFNFRLEVTSKINYWKIGDFHEIRISKKNDYLSFERGWHILYRMIENFSASFDMDISKKFRGVFSVSHEQ